MSFTQAERIALSKKLVEIPREIATANRVKSLLAGFKQDVEDLDSANKVIMDDVTVLINPYQLELTQYDANLRTQLLEQDMIDSASRTLANYFFPNDATTPIPSVPDGVWKFFVSFSKSKAIGKEYEEVFPAIVIKEQDKIDAINTQIAIVEAAIDATRSSGKRYDASGTCSNPIYTTQIDCTNNGGIWISGLDVTSNDAVIQQALIDIKAAVQDWEDFINTTKSYILTTDPDIGRQAQNNIAIADIDNTISIIDTWQSLDDFDTTTSLPATCAAFDALLAASFQPSKLRITELQLIKDEITARQAFIAIRDAEVTTNLGGVNQDISNGSIISYSGLYGERFGAIELRLNAINGSLQRSIIIGRGNGAQDEIIAYNNNALITYSTVIKVSLFRAPAAGTGTIHVLDTTGFTVSDPVFIVADTQAEISATILNIQGNTVFLDVNIPRKYRQDDNARLYKLL